MGRTDHDQFERFSAECELEPLIKGPGSKNGVRAGQVFVAD